MNRSLSSVLCAVACLTNVAVTFAAPSEPLAPTEAPPAVAKEDADDPIGSVYVDPLGFLLFGPSVGAELAVNKHLSFLVQVRWFNVGLLSNELFITNDNDSFAFSPGIGAKGRYYLNSGLTGPHVGVACELLQTRVVDEQVAKTATNNLVVVPELEAGYRLGFGRFYAGASATAGYAFQVSSRVENVNGGTDASSYEAKDISTVYGSASLDLGLLF